MSYLPAFGSLPGSVTRMMEASEGDSVAARLPRCHCLTEMRRWLHEVRHRIRFQKTWNAQRRSPAARALSPRDRLRAWRAGFTPRSYRLFDLSRRDHGDYVSDLTRVRSAGLHGDQAIVFCDKLVFAAVVGQWVRVPKSLAVFTHGHFTWLDRGSAGCGDLAGLVRARGRVVIKPVVGGRGIRVHVLRAVADQLHCDDHPVDEAYLETAFADPRKRWLVCEHLEQGTYARRLFPDSVNTLRLVTLLDPRTAEPFVAAAVQRMGTRRSAPVDNNQRGGISCAVDLATGRLGRGAQCPPDAVPRWFDAHPDSGAPFAQLVVPDWKRTLDTVLGLAARLPGNPFVGWDLALLDDGIVAIEGNHNPGTEVLQVHAPFLRDERVREFYAHHRLL